MLDIGQIYNFLFFIFSRKIYIEKSNRGYVAYLSVADISVAYLLVADFSAAYFSVAFVSEAGISEGRYICGR